MKGFENEKVFNKLAEKVKSQKTIDNELYAKYQVKRGLRDLNGEGVVAGLTAISDVVAKKTVDGVKIPCEGELYYRGMNVKDIVFSSGLDRFRFEEVAYLLLFDELPTAREFEDFKAKPFTKVIKICIMPEGSTVWASHIHMARRLTYTV